MEWSCLACGSQVPDTFSFCGHCGAERSSAARNGGEVDDVVRALVGEQLRAELIEHGGRLPEERRLVSALFADLSGFTSLAGRLDPETLAMVVDPILAGLVRIVKRGEGHVGAFAGDAVLCYFGAPVAHEDDAVRAVRCAAEMLAEFPALLAVAPKEAADLTLRIGVDTGAVMARLVAGDIRTDYNILGNSVNMAQRLQSNAPPGGLVVGETTYRLTLDDYEYDDIGPLQVKGRDEPLPAYLLLGPRERTVLRRTAHSERVHGREDDLAAIDVVLAPGPARGLAIVADAGTGKSRLLQEARSRSDRTWYEGGCAPHERDRSYRPWVHALGPLTEGPVADGLRILLGRDLDDDIDLLPPAVRRDLVGRDVARLLRDAAPCVVVLEDLHWADQPTLDLLDDVLFEAGDADVAVIATSREKVPAAAELAVLELGALEPPAVAALVSDLLGGDPPDDLVTEVVRRSGGNPLYVVELALVIRDRGLVSLVDGDVLVTTAAGLARALDLVPDSVEGLIGARIDALPAAQERVLTIASALGSPVDERLVAEVAAELGEPDAEVPDALAGLRAAHLIAGHDFVHALVMSTTYSRTPRARRRRLHLAAAAVGPQCIADHDLPGYLARHLYLAGAGTRALTALENAVEDALTRGAHDEALLHLYRDLELRRSEDIESERRAVLPERLVVTGELLELLGRYEEAEPHFREAIALQAGPVAYRGLVGSLRRLGRYDDVVAIADEVIGSDDIDDAMQVRLSWEKAAALASLGRLEASLDALLPGVDAASEARQDLIRAYCYLLRSDPEAAEAALVPALEVLEAAGDSTSYLHGRRNLGAVRAAQDRHEEAIAILDDTLRLARAHGLAEEALSCLLNLGSVASGRPDLELRYCREAVIQSDRMRHSFHRAVSRNNLADTLVAMDRPEEAELVATRALSIAEEYQISGVVAVILATRGAARLRLDNLTDAEADAKAAEPLAVGTPFEDEVRDLLDEIRGRR